MLANELTGDAQKHCRCNLKDEKSPSLYARVMLLLHWQEINRQADHKTDIYHTYIVQVENRAGYSDKPHTVMVRQ